MTPDAVNLFKAGGIIFLSIHYGGWDGGGKQSPQSYLVMEITPGRLRDIRQRIDELLADDTDPEDED